MAEKMTSAAPIVVQSENSNFNIGVVLDENNYDLWAPLVEMHVAGRRKTGYLRGSMKAPEEDDPKYDDWFSEDQRVKSWLLSTMKPELMKRHIRLPTAAAIWRTLKTALWMRRMEKIAMKNEADHAEAMVARNHIPQRHGERFGSDRMSRSKCAHCGRPGHSKQKCFELIGYPEGWDKTRDPRHGKPRAQIAETKNFLRTGKEELNLVAEHAADDHSIALIAASGHEAYEFQGESSSHTEIHNLSYKDIALPDEVHHDKDNDKMALESPSGTGKEPLPGELTEAPDNVQQCAEPINSNSGSP
ncbi:hypothetical protein DKX38_006310 [Salix brachista]|uniref:CCHC-type domain-containing protein n=1 Tax=Salix brachista TaxID=2182728 RepID=A0A5N5N3Y4_9ROSI|nr:hypothetical protein DKX38_006310 [Salix brachista]